MPGSKEIKNIWNKSDFSLIFLVFLVISIVSLATNTMGTIDIPDYAGSAKLFSGELSSKIRSSHSLFYGLIHFPLVSLTNNFLALKIINLIYLFGIVVSIYYMTNKNRKALFLILFSPLLWYMGPWINPIQIASLLFLWGYFFMKKYENSGKFTLLIVSGIFVGLSWAFWDAIIYFSIILGISFLYNKKTSHTVIYFMFVLVGLSPKLLTDQLMFNSFFIGIVRYVASTVVTVVSGGIYGNLNVESSNLISLFSVLILLPVFFYKLFGKEKWKINKSAVINLLLSTMLILINAQPRYLLLIIPIIIYELSPNLTNSKLKIHFIISAILIFLIIMPYFIQAKYDTNAKDFTLSLQNIKNLEIEEVESEVIAEDLERISAEFPKESFVVGPANDDYLQLSILYWGKNVEEFVSIEDYRMVYENEFDIYSLEYSPAPSIKDRREIWMAGGIRRNTEDETDYDQINLAISKTSEIDLEGFVLKKKYKRLYLFEKAG